MECSINTNCYVYTGYWHILAWKVKIDIVIFITPVWQDVQWGGECTEDCPPARLCVGERERWKHGSWNVHFLNHLRRKKSLPTGFSHHFWFQIQGQMAVCGLQWADFVLYTHIEVRLLMNIWLDLFTSTIKISL